LINLLFYLRSRFIINIPSEQRFDLVRIFFAVELAHWFYIDFYCEDDIDPFKSHIKDFAQQSIKSIDICI
jgi:mRNA-decapping enzyme subunit 2